MTRFCGQCTTRLPANSLRCEACGTWNRVTAKTVPAKPVRRVKKLREIDTTSEVRLATGWLDTLLGGGLVEGSVVLVAGDPGIGKSTLLMQLAKSLDAARVSPVLYASGEETLKQLAPRGARLGLPDHALLLADHSIDLILEESLALRARVLIVDSIQTVASDDIDSPAGSVAQVRGGAQMLVDYAKEQECAVWIAGHITREGSIAGPALLEHLVDTVLHFTQDDHTQLKALRVVKNRFGPSNISQYFLMTAAGLIPQDDPELAQSLPGA